MGAEPGGEPGGDPGKDATGTFRLGSPWPEPHLTSLCGSDRGAIVSPPRQHQGTGGQDSTKGQHLSLIHI